MYVYVYFFMIRLDFDYVSFILFVAKRQNGIEFKCKEYDAYQTTLDFVKKKFNSNTYSANEHSYLLRE